MKPLVDEGPYRSCGYEPPRRLDASRRLSRALRELGYGPEADAFIYSPSICTDSLRDTLRQASERISRWYAKYLFRELRASHTYEDAIVPASLISFSQDPVCIKLLGNLLHSSNPLEVLVSAESLADLVVLSPSGSIRRLAVIRLFESNVPLAHSELLAARRASIFPSSLDEDVGSSTVDPATLPFV